MRRLALVICCASTAALAQPAPAPGSSKQDAKALNALGVKLLEGKDYLGALAVFKESYARFHSTKTLLNIGTTLKLLDRKADAANTYQRYLDAADADPAKRAEVAQVIAELDRGVGQLAITVAPADAEVQVDDDEWMPAAAAKLWRVPEGTFHVRARKDKYQPETKTASIRAGEQQEISITLAALPEEPVRVVQPVDSGVAATVVPDEPRSRVGALVLGHFEPPAKGGAALVGVTADVTGLLQVQGAAIVGPTFGGYAGATMALLPGRFRPLVAAGMPIFASSGARFALRGAGGVEVEINRHVAVLVELGVEYLLNPEPEIRRTLFVPAVGASGRL
ncbi:MAG TPA: tetratricopeptide repeat protein [Kofleriaceae bacterium]|nr:tetratricopeptide repeat protein [Kofleriaceae bacterium]